MEENKMRIPDGWEEVELGKLIIERPKSKLKVSDATGFGNYPFFTSGEAILLHHKKQLDGENIFLATGGVANVKYYDGEVSYSTDTYAVTSDTANLQYLYYFILDKLYYIDSNYFLGSGLKHLQKKDFKSHLLVIPKSLTEQKKIAEILSTVDKAIEQTEQLIAKYQRIKTGLMQDLLTKGIDENGNIRSEETHKFKDSPLGRIPLEWECVNLNKIGSKGSPYLKTGPFGSALKIEHWKEEGIPVVTIGSLGNNYFITENLLFISYEKASELSSYKLYEGDILFSRVADIGRSLVIKKEQQNWIMSSNFMRLRLNKSVYNSEFLQLVIKFSFQFKKQVSENVNESGRSVTNSKTLNEFIFPKIDIDEQLRIIKEVETIDNHSNLLYLEKQKLQRIKTALMQDLLSGQKRVTHLLKEEAL